MSPASCGSTNFKSNLEREAWVAHYCPLVTHHVRYPCRFCLCVTPLPRWSMSPISPGSFFQGAWFVLTFGFKTGTSSSPLVLLLSKSVKATFWNLQRPFLHPSAYGTRPDWRLFILPTHCVRITAESNLWLPASNRQTNSTLSWHAMSGSPRSRSFTAFYSYFHRSRPWSSSSRRRLP